MPELYDRIMSILTHRVHRAHPTLVFRNHRSGRSIMVSQDPLIPLYPQAGGEDGKEDASKYENRLTTVANR
jgi:hypothetical protein